MLQQIYKDLGPLRSLHFTGVTLEDSDSYRAEFANGAAVYTILLSPDGKIATMNYRPAPPGAQ